MTTEKVWGCSEGHAEDWCDRGGQGEMEAGIVVLPEKGQDPHN